MLLFENEIKKELSKYNIKIDIIEDNSMIVPMKTVINIVWIFKDIDLELHKMKYNSILLSQLSPIERKKTYKHEIAHILTERKFMKILKKHQFEYQKGDNFNTFIRKHRVLNGYNDKHGMHFQKIATKIGGHTEPYIYGDYKYDNN